MDRALSAGDEGRARSEDRGCDRQGHAARRHEGCEAALYDLGIALYRDRKVSDVVYKAALEKFGERGIMDIVGIMGYYDLVSMTLITMQAGSANDSVPPLPALEK